MTAVQFLQGAVVVASVTVLCVAAVVTEGPISTFAGTGTDGYSGDGGAATSAQLDDPAGLAVDSNGHVYIADNKNDVVRKVDASTGIITTYAGTGIAGYSGDGGLATLAQLDDPRDVAVDAAGHLYIADKKNDVVRKVNVSTLIITTFAGDGSGDVYIADKKNNVVRKVDGATLIVTTFAGTGIEGYSGDGGPAVSAELTSTLSLAVDSSEDVYIGGSSKNHESVVRKVLGGGHSSVKITSWREVEPQ